MKDSYWYLASVRCSGSTYGTPLSNGNMPRWPDDTHYSITLRLVRKEVTDVMDVGQQRNVPIMREAGSAVTRRRKGDALLL